MNVILRPVDPAADAPLLHGWVTEDRAAFWGMTDCDEQRVREIYEYIDEQDHLAAYLLLLLAGDPRRAGRTGEVIAAGLSFVLGQPGCARLVFEPDARNAASLALLERIGAERGPLVDLRTSIAEKPAQFFFLERGQM